jgi:GH35 family endo-1,4-beta-xylanase
MEPIITIPPSEKLQATFRFNIKIEKDTSTGELKTFITELDMGNYDGLIKDIPLFLSEHSVRYGINLIQEHLKTAAQ